MKINVHAGHCPQGKGAYGAVGILQESVEDRLVKDEVIRLLREQGHTVYDCTCDLNTSKSGCLRKIVEKCNQHKVDLDASFHLNSGRGDLTGDKKTGGIEVYLFPSACPAMVAIAEQICTNVSADLGIRNRGVKFSKNLYVLRNTNSPAMLIECCFVDDKDDADRWDPVKCAIAIARAMDSSIDHVPSTSKPAPAPAPVPPAQPKNKILVDGIWGKDTTRALQRNFKLKNHLYVDGIISNQPSCNMKYMPAISCASWMFKTRNWGKGSPAIRALQQHVGAVRDGLMGRDTVKKLQFFLKQDCYYAGEIDGIMGKGTVRALQQYLNDR